MNPPSARRALPWIAALALTVPVGGAGCTILADLQDFGQGIPACEDGSDQEIRDFWLVLDAMGMHVDQLVEIRIIADGEDDQDFLVAVARLDGLPAADFTVHMPGAVPPGPHRLDFWADLSGNRRYDVPPADHSWSPPVCVSGAYRFTHAPSFVDIEDPPPLPVGGDFTLRLNGFDELEGSQVVAWVEAGDMSGRTVGYYHLKALPAADATLVLPGVMEDGAGYAVALYVDRDGNGRYDPPPVDDAWLLDGTADASGLTLDFTYNADQVQDISPFLPSSALKEDAR